MLQFKNSTPFPGTVYITPDANGIDTAYAILKATYKLTREPVPADEQAPVALADEFYGEPAKTSIRTSSDFALTKPATDVLLQGLAYAPRGQAASYADVSLTVADRIDKVVRVFGDRAWHGAGVTAFPSGAAPFEVMPLTWERASGAPDNPANPVGCGLERPPNLEDPRQPVSSPRDRVAPAAFGPIAAHWEPRRSCAGTYDENWQKNRAPYLPPDFNLWFFQMAPRDQVVPGYLQGGEPVRLMGCTPDVQLSFHLPRHRVQFGFRVDDDFQVRDANLDTVVFDTAAMLMKLTWRASIACDKKALRIREVKVRVV